MQFVLQRHESTHPHFDFRLERDGRYVSWAVPKGLPVKKGQRRLAIRVPDHSLEFGTFEGDIPAGEYGAGSVRIADHGTYDCASWNDDRIVVQLHGLHGDEWLMIRTG